MFHRESDTEAPDGLMRRDEGNALTAEMPGSSAQEAGGVADADANGLLGRRGIPQVCEPFGGV
jgi:hypothetical protein